MARFVRRDAGALSFTNVVGSLRQPALVQSFGHALAGVLVLGPAPALLHDADSHLNYLN